MSDAMAQTRQNTIEPILQALEDSKLCVIPTDALLLLLEDNASFQQKANEINENIANTLNILKEAEVKVAKQEGVGGGGGGVVEDGKAGTTDDPANEIVSKLDELITAIKQSTKTAKPEIPDMTRIEEEEVEDEKAMKDEELNQDEIKQFLGERYSIQEKIVHNEQLSSYYRSLLHEEIPYAPKKFRMKVYKNTPESELKHRRAQTLDAVNTEIKIMEERAVEWRKARQDIDLQIEIFLAKHDSQRSAVKHAIDADDREILENFEKEYLGKRRNSDRRCKETSSEYLLIFVDDKCHDQSDVLSSMQCPKTLNSKVR